MLNCRNISKKNSVIKIMITKKKLKNEMTALTVPIKGTRAITAWVLFPVGSRYENKKISGASHFVEHMMFKGTERRPTAMDISRELDAVGAEYNAFTFKDYTGYYVKIAGDKQEMAFDVLSDMVFHSRLDAEEVKREKGVIIEEMRMYEDNPIMAVDSLLDKITFGDCPLGRDIIGNHKTLNRMTRDDLWNYYKNAYQPRHAIVVTAGAIDKKTPKLIEKYFGSEKNQKTEKNKQFKASGFKKFVFTKKSLPFEKRLLTDTRKLDQAQLLLGFPGIKYTEKQRDALTVLLSVLSGGMSSRLFTEVREKRGLAYMVRANHTAYRDTGFLSIQAGLDPAKLGDAVNVIRDELKKISREKVSKKELANAKSFLLGHFVLSMEDSDNQAAYFAKNLMFLGKVVSFDEAIRRIKKVRAEEILALSKKLFVEREMRAALVSPLTRAEVIKILK